jgi:membrane associated rhomboid family serine protease
LEAFLARLPVNDLERQMSEQWPICTYLVIGVTTLFSYLGFRSRALEEKHIFHPESILAWKEYYRLLTAGFLHAGWWHLLFNMVSLYLFGPAIELVIGSAQFLVIYLGAIVGGNLLSLYVHRHHEYQAYGASGGVCGIIFAYILLFPGSQIVSFSIPLPVPGWLYAIGFMLGSFFGMRGNNKGNIGHDAHLGGAIVGLLIAAGLHPESVRQNIWVFLIALGVAVPLLIYLWINPSFLPISSFFGRGSGSGRRSKAAPKQKRENLEVDAILDKIAKSGIQSLTSEEKALLGQVSEKYKRRAESKKPESGLAI